MLFEALGFSAAVTLIGHWEMGGGGGRGRGFFKIHPP